MAKKTLGADLKAQMTFDYYKQQREEFMNLARERTLLSLQFLIILGALSAAFFQASSVALKLGITGVMVILGGIGLVINISVEREMRMHVARARAARKSLGFLEEYANVRPGGGSTARGIRQNKLYNATMALIMVVGVIFALTLVAK